MRLLALLLAALIVTASQAAPRSRAAVAQFKRENPCPATGRPRGRCPGWIVDHVIPLCAGGPDYPGNMRWAVASEAAKRDKEEWALCRAIRRGDADSSDLCMASHTLQLHRLENDLCVDSRHEDVNSSSRGARPIA